MSLNTRVHRGLTPGLSFYCDRKGLEVDAIVERGTELLAVENKSSQTVADDFFAALRSFAAVLAKRKRAPRPSAMVVYGGTQPQRRGNAAVVPWTQLDSSDWT